MAQYDLTLADFDVDGARIAIVASRFNQNTVEALLEGVMQTLTKHGVPASGIEVFQVPGAFEIPQTTRRVVRTGRFDAVITLGAVIRGDTPHFEYIAASCANGIAQVALEEDLPVIFGVLTVDNQAQADARTGGSEGNKGAESALAALEMISVMRRLAR